MAEVFFGVAFIASVLFVAVELYDRYLDEYESEEENAH